MNNKLFKLAVVLVTIVVVLCSFASAATINSLSCTEAKDKIEMNVIFADDATRGAYIAYAAQKVDAGTVGAEVVGEESFVLGPIVAIFQADTEQYLKLGNHGESINPELIPEECGHIVLKAGDNGVDSTVAASFAAEIPVAVTKYNIKFVNYDGTELKTIEVAEGETPVYDGETPVKAADAQYTYAFAGWTPEIVAATADATYTATYTETVNEYTITWIVDGVETTETYAYGATPEFKGSTDKAADAENTYAFTGWNPAIAEVTGDATYTATYEATPIEPEVPAVTVTFVNGAETTEIEAVDGVVALPAAPANIGLTAEESASGLYPTNSVLKFVGWANADDTALYTANLTEVAENITLYAKFESNFVKGDVTGDGKVNIPDRAQIIPYVTKNGTQAFGNVGKTIHPLIPDVAGDVTNDKKVNIPDRAQIIPYVTKNGAQMFGSVGNKIYFINK